ncbi:hypothetical protein Patl1_31457 [Pistacia atlantica]|uniref:Uncharacterized protein n=1 Tax=Pistacia atlantica TaxID=434234 RepID=A0ACC1APD7_9ROSI|nr:hypothetical protein Patl1_31457 [Pistacia atlantica]
MKFPPNFCYFLCNLLSRVSKEEIKIGEIIHNSSKVLWFFHRFNILIDLYILFLEQFRSASICYFISCSFEC